MRHGASKYANAGCRCDICRDANTARAINERKTRAVRLAADPSLAPHGKAATYRNWHCRCQPCTDANSAMCREYKRARRPAMAS